MQRKQVGGAKAQLDVTKVQLGEARAQSGAQNRKETQNTERDNKFTLVLEYAYPSTKSPVLLTSNSPKPP